MNRSCCWLCVVLLLPIGFSTHVFSGEQPRPPVPPLHTEGRFIVDSKGSEIKLASVNWYGAEELDFVVAGLEIENLQTIAQRIAAMGFNSVRLPWSNEMYERDPIVEDHVVAANPALRGKHAMEVFDAVIAALAKEGLLIILDNHMSEAEWCCSDTDGNGLWYTLDYPEESWIADWQGITQRYMSQPAIVGVDLRNEPRCVRGVGCASWSASDPRFDWPAAAERAGNAVLAVNPSLLVMVEGVQYAWNLIGARARPILLKMANRLVYSPHDYWWLHSITTLDELRKQLDTRWGYLLEPDQPYTAPIWVGEFGTCHTRETCVRDSTPGAPGFWFSGFIDYLGEREIDWAYWAVNGTQARGRGRRFGAEETYGIFDRAWNEPALLDLLAMLQGIAVPEFPKLQEDACRDQNNIRGDY